MGDAAELATLLPCASRQYWPVYLQTLRKSCDMSRICSEYESTWLDFRAALQTRSRWQGRPSVGEVVLTKGSCRKLGLCCEMKQNEPPLSARKIDMTSGQSFHVPVSPPQQQKRRRHLFSPRRQYLGTVLASVRVSVIAWLCDTSSMHALSTPSIPVVVETFRYA